MKNKTYLRSLFNLSLRSKCNVGLLRDPVVTALRRERFRRDPAPYSTRMYYQSPEGVTSNIEVQFDMSEPDTPPHLYIRRDEEPVIVMGTDFLHGSDGVVLRVAVARALADLFSPPWSDTSYTANERKARYYEDDLYRRAVCATTRPDDSVHDGFTENYSLGLVRRSDHSAAMNLIRARFFAVVRGGALTKDIEADAVAARYCGRKDVSVYLTSQMATDPTASNLEILNRIKTLNASLEEPKPLRMGLYGKVFLACTNTSA